MQETNFDYLLSLVFGHSVLFESKELYKDVKAYCGPDPSANSAGLHESTDAQMQAYIKNLPALLQVTANSTLPVGQTLQDAQNKLAPQEQALNNSLYGKYAPDLYNIGNQLNNQQNAAGINQASAALNGSGGQLLNQAIGADKTANPEYYNIRAKTGQSLSDLLGSININGLSGSERAEVERGLNQQDAQRGILNTPSQTATVNNAMQFGSALGAKRNQLAQAISTATNFLPSSLSNVNSFGVGTGQATQQGNPGASQFLGTGTNTNNASNTNSGLANSLLGGINNTANTAMNINANRRDSLDRTNEVWGNVNGTLGSL